MKAWFPRVFLSFSPLFSYLQQLFFISLSKSFSSPTLFLLRVPLDPVGAGPRQCWERLKAGGEEDDRGCDGWMALPIRWT